MPDIKTGSVTVTGFSEGRAQKKKLLPLRWDI